MTHTFIPHIMRRRRMRIQTGCHCAAAWSQLDPIFLHPLCLQCFHPPTGMPPTSTSFPCTFPYTFPYIMQLLGLNPILSSPIVPPSCHWNATHNNKYFLSGWGPNRFHDSFNCWGVHFMRGRHSLGHGFDLLVPFVHLNDASFGTRLGLICAI